jgi:hypothetical protein
MASASLGTPNGGATGGHDDADAGTNPNGSDGAHGNVDAASDGAHSTRIVPVSDNRCPLPEGGCQPHCGVLEDGGCVDPCFLAGSAGGICAIVCIAADGGCGWPPTK